MNLSRSPNARRSKPLFQLTNVVDIKVVRSTGEWVKGRWVETNYPNEIIIEGNVQPLKFQEILQLDESERTREWIKIYTTYHLVTSEESAETGNPADRVIWEGHSYRVMKEKHYVMGVLDHRCVYCAREPLSAEG